MDAWNGARLLKKLGVKRPAASTTATAAYKPPQRLSKDDEEKSVGPISMLEAKFLNPEWLVSAEPAVSATQKCVEFLSKERGFLTGPVASPKPPKVVPLVTYTPSPSLASGCSERGVEGISPLTDLNTKDRKPVDKLGVRRSLFQINNTPMEKENDAPSPDSDLFVDQEGFNEDILNETVQEDKPETGLQEDRNLPQKKKKAACTTPSLASGCSEKVVERLSPLTDLNTKDRKPLDKPGVRRSLFSKKGRDLTAKRVKAKCTTQADSIISDHPLSLASCPEKDSKRTMQLRQRNNKTYPQQNLSDEEDDLFLSISDNDDDSTWKPDGSSKSGNCNIFERSADSDTESPQASKKGSQPSSAPSVAPSASQLENSSVHESDGDEDDNDTDNDETPPKSSERDIKRERRRLRNIGQQYTTSSGKIVKARKCRVLPSCKAKWCKIKEIPEEERQKIFEEYWALGDFNKRAQYVSNRIIKNQVKTCKRRGEETKKDRTCTLEYSLIHNEKRLTVSKGCFLATLDENDRFVRGILERRSSTVQVPDDSRGKHPPANKLSEEVRQGVVLHIRKFPAYVSHYSRRHTGQLYLGSHLNVATMHNLYLEEGNPKISYHSYLDIFKSLRPKLKFKNPQIDTCVTCDSFKNSVEAAQSPNEKETLQKQFDEHVNKADFAYKCKAEDKCASKTSSGKMSTIVFDLQQVLPCPYLTGGNVFYLRQLSVYNLTVFETTLSQAFNFMWHEATAGRGADEIASCLVTFINDFLPRTVTHLILYSDTCSGQNKNSLMLGALALTVQQHPSLETIDQKFLVSGHTHLECDQAHHRIEEKKKRTNIALHHPQNYFDMVREVGPAKKKYIVREMKQDDIFSFEPIVKGSDAPLVWRKTDCDGNPFLFSEAEWFRLQKHSPGIILYKKSLKVEEPFLKLNWKRKKNVPLPEIELYQKRNKPCAISSEKKKDLLSMLNQVNPLYHDFYRNLPCDKDVLDEDPDLPPEFDVANEFL